MLRVVATPAQRSEDCHGPAWKVDSDRGRTGAASRARPSGALTAAVSVAGPPRARCPSRRAGADMTFATDRSADVPVFSRCVVGFRAWVADEQSRLWPITDTRRSWAPGINQARCNRPATGSLRLQWAIREGRAFVAPAPLHDAPIAECDCGLYSWRRPPGWWVDGSSEAARLPGVVGAVASWGSLQVHDDGFRAQYACVVAIAQPDDVTPAELAELAAIARRYRAELVPLDQFEPSPAALAHRCPRTCAHRRRRPRPPSRCRRLRGPSRHRTRPPTLSSRPDLSGLTGVRCDPRDFASPAAGLRAPDQHHRSRGRDAGPRPRLGISTWACEAGRRSR